MRIIINILDKFDIIWYNGMYKFNLKIYIKGNLL